MHPVHPMSSTYIKVVHSSGPVRFFQSPLCWCTRLCRCLLPLVWVCRDGNNHTFRNTADDSQPTTRVWRSERRLHSAATQQPRTDCTLMSSIPLQKPIIVVCRRVVSSSGGPRHPSTSEATSQFQTSYPQHIHTCHHTRRARRWPLDRHPCACITSSSLSTVAAPPVRTRPEPT